MRFRACPKINLDRPTDELCDLYRRLWQRLDEVDAVFPGTENEALHTKWCERWGYRYQLYIWCEDELVYRNAELPDMRKNNTTT